jgi:hypothetical protein
LRIFFDNCTSPVLPAALHAFLETKGSSAHHVRFMSDYGFDEHTDDEEWIKRLGSDKPADWIVVTGDKRITRNKAERAAWVRTGLKGFVLASGFQKMPVHRQASLLLWRWPDMEAFITAAAAGSIFELPSSRSGKFRPLPV